MTYHVLSLGAGVNSTALLHYIVDHDMPLDEVIFADTGGERPATYAYLQSTIIPFLKDRKIPFTIVRNKGLTLYERCMNGKYLPDRQYRWQTRDFKIRPIHRYLRPKGRVLCYVGIAYDEIERMKQAWVECLTCGKLHRQWTCAVCGKAHSKKKEKANAYGHPYQKIPMEYDHVVDPWLVNSWPLIDKRITRQGCENIITMHGWKVPPKSGCFFCPLQPLAQWYWTWKNEPEQYAAAMRLEKNCKIYPVFTLVDGGLEALAERFKREDAERAKKEAVYGRQVVLFSEKELECSGYCMT